MEMLFLKAAFSRIQELNLKIRIFIGFNLFFHDSIITSK